MKKVLDKINETLWELVPLALTCVVILAMITLTTFVIVGLVKLIRLM